MSSTFRSNQVSQADTSISVPGLSKSITIFINEGHPETTASFTVPENLLIEKSQYFKDLCNIKPAGNHNNIRTSTYTGRAKTGSPSTPEWIMTQDTWTPA
jgi:hypothetical protein